MSPRNAAALRGNPGRSLREHLIEAAADLIAEQGTADLTVRAIARAGGVADGVLYNHFADKEELLAHALLAHVRRVQGRLGALPAPGAGTVRDGLRAHLAYGMELHRGMLPAFASLLGRPQVLTRFAGLTGEDQWRDRLLAHLRAERDLGRLAPDADLEAATAMLVGACHEPVIATMFDPANGAAYHPPSTPEALVDTVLDGIGVGHEQRVDDHGPP